jgi:hypothetical protein
MFSFSELKRIAISDVCRRYDVKLTLKKEVYLNALCPLPTHPEGSRRDTFSIHMPSNTFRCFNTGCCGGEPEDVITFVRLIEELGTAKEAAAKLAEWYGVNGNTPRRERVNSANKTAPHIEARVVRGSQGCSPLAAIPDNSKPSASVKIGYMQAVGLWFDTFIVRQPNEADDAYVKRLKTGFMTQLRQSYLNGKSGQSELKV